MSGGVISNRILVALPLAATLLFWSTLFLFAAARPDYSHWHNAVSELGVWGV